MVKKVAILGDDWQPDTDVLTPTSKLKRRGVKERYAAEIAHIATWFADHHGDRIAVEAGVEGGAWSVDMDGVRALYGVSGDTNVLTHREVQARRDVIASRLAQRERPRLTHVVADRARGAWRRVRP